MASRSPKILCLFDVDNTLVPPRPRDTSEYQRVSPEMLSLLAELRGKNVSLGIVSAADFKTLATQFAGSAADNARQLMTTFEYVFPFNGLHTYQGEVTPVQETSFRQYIEPEQYKKLVNFVLHYLAGIEIPVKGDLFIELRTGMLHITPMGRGASDEERKDFISYDNIHAVRQKFIDALRNKFKNGPEKAAPGGTGVMPVYGKDDNDGKKCKFDMDAVVNIGDKELTFSTASPISIDIIPKGWDKSYCLDYLANKGFDEIHFFGDKTRLGGNDFEIFEDKRTIGHTVSDPENTMAMLRTMFGLTSKSAEKKKTENGEAMAVAKRDKAAREEREKAEKAAREEREKAEKAAREEMEVEDDIFPSRSRPPPPPSNTMSWLATRDRSGRPKV